MTFDKIFTDNKSLPGVVQVNHSSFSDLRGTLWTSYDDDLASKMKHLTGFSFSHDKFALNKKNVLRGIHGDEKSWKLVTVISGRVFQVVVDCRESSEHFLNFTSLYLDSSQPMSVLIPPGFGNAFMSITDDSVYHYKLAYPGDYNDADNQFTYKWNDPRIGINWPSTSPILSERDT